MGSRSTVLVAVSLTLFAALAAAQAPVPPSSLKLPLGDLYPSGTELKNATSKPTGTTACGTPMKTTPPNPPAETDSKFTYAIPFDMMGAAGPTTYHIRDGFTVDVSFTAPDTSAPFATSGFKVHAELKGLTSDTKTLPQGSSTPQTLTFTVNQTNIQEDPNGGAIELDIILTPNPPQAGIPTVQNVAIACGPTKVSNLAVYRGLPADIDTDGDGKPDTQDLDDDGDAALDTAEGKLTCKIGSETANFTSDPRIAPGKDSDDDGIKDEVECAKGSDPTNKGSVPAKPKTFMDYLGTIITLLVIILILAALVWLYLRFGKSAIVTVVSPATLFIPPGQKAKYEIAVENLAKKGEPKTFQLSAQGMPEGWDAKLNVQAVTLDPVGGAKPRETVWLEVEAPDHKEAESAVVIVKATPLNAAGRKEALKRPGKAETITSINVPEGSRIPVKRGAAVKPAEKPKEEVAPAAGQPAPGLTALRPVIDIEGIGETYSQKLDKRGIKTIGDLRAANADDLAKKIGATPEQVRSWQQMGELMEVEGIGPQYSEQLVRAGITSVSQLAAADPKEVVASIERLNEGREVRIQGNVITPKVAKHWVKAAKKSPLAQSSSPATAAPAAAPTPAVEAEPEPAPPPKKGKKAAEPARVAPVPAAAPVAAGGKPAIQVGGLSHEPPAFRQGETVKSRVSVTNSGAAPSTLKLSLFVNDGLADVQTVTVKPGKSKDVQFKWTAQERNKLNIRGELVPG